jgi:hypothetical protein
VRWSVVCMIMIMSDKRREEERHVEKRDERTYRWRPPTSHKPRRPRVCLVDQLKAAACIRSRLVCRRLMGNEALHLSYPLLSLSPFVFIQVFSKCMLACPISCEKRFMSFSRAAKRSSDVLFAAQPQSDMTFLEVVCRVQASSSFISEVAKLRSRKTEKLRSSWRLLLFLTCTCPLILECLDASSALPWNGMEWRSI